MSKTRIEKDSFGELEIPAEAYYGVHTVRSVRNFGAAGEPVPLEMIYGMAKMKLACAKANHHLGLLDDKKTAAIVAACERVLKGEFDDQFPIDCFHAGSGTSSNMNVNEVMANIANEILGGKRGDRGLVHPNDDVNKGQSTNNIFPSAIRVANVDLAKGTLTALHQLIAALEAKAVEFGDVIKSGRTHLQDAVPVTLGQEFAAWAHALKKAVGRIERARDADSGSGRGRQRHRHRGQHQEGVPAPDREVPGRVHGRRLPAGRKRHRDHPVPDRQGGDVERPAPGRHGHVGKICNDLRLMCSGPNTGISRRLCCRRWSRAPPSCRARSIPASRRPPTWP
jgi:aspartate ammonia-lyase